MGDDLGTCWGSSSRDDLRWYEPGVDERGMGFGGGTGITLVEFDRPRFCGGGVVAGTYGVD